MLIYIQFLQWESIEAILQEIIKSKFDHSFQGIVTKGDKEFAKLGNPGHGADVMTTIVYFSTIFSKSICMLQFNTEACKIVEF